MPHNGLVRSPRLFIRDRNSQETFLVDTGSDVSLLPSYYSKKMASITEFALYSVNHKPVRTFGFRRLTIRIGLPNQYSWNFIVADIKTPIIGADFLQHYHILPDLTTRKLIHGSTALCKCAALREVLRPRKQKRKMVGLHVRFDTNT